MIRIKDQFRVSIRVYSGLIIYYFYLVEFILADLTFRVFFLVDLTFVYL